ncbi:ABC transporter permease subunit [Microbacterium sp. MEC084]|nr:ABC transporter permease [Microbacterium sp. MEC084]KQZ12014.1 peptide ABC transporter permease [Microbacterium sp. Root53]MCD1269381.1 ABC transporter permease subunit [Microbacterium sp. MEC084]
MTDTQAVAVAPSGRGLRDRRFRVLLHLCVGVIVVAAVIIASGFAQQAADTTHLDAVNQAPSWEHWFGTDRLGRDMLARTLVGLRLSLVVGTTAALMSSIIALTLAAAAVSLGRSVATAVDWLVDFVLALPHLVLLILIAFAMGGGTHAVILAVGLSHWPTLTRVLRTQAKQVIASDFVSVSRGLGTPRLTVIRRHLAPHLLPHFLVGTVLVFPHAILHEAALSFLGFGIDATQPAIGNILAESMTLLSAGMWWLAVLPGVCLLAIVKLIDSTGENLRSVTDPRSYHL